MELWSICAKGIFIFWHGATFLPVAHDENRQAEKEGAATDTSAIDHFGFQRLLNLSKQWKHLSRFDTDYSPIYALEQWDHYNQSRTYTSG